MSKKYTVVTLIMVFLLLFNSTVVLASSRPIARQTAPFTCTNSTDIRWIGQWNVYIESTTTVGGYNGWTAGNFSGLRIRGNGTAISIVYIKQDASYVFIDVAADTWSAQILDDTTWLEVITTVGPGEGISVDFCPSDDQPDTCSLTTELLSLGANQWNAFWDQTVTTVTSEYYGWQSGNYNGYKIRSSGVGIMVTYIEPDEEYVTLTAENSEWVTISNDTRWMEAYISSVSAPENITITMAPVAADCGDEQKPSGNILIDGDMEQWFKSTGWSQVDFGTITKNNGKVIPYTWDRINTSAPGGGIFSNGFSYWWNNGDAKCGTGYQGIGKLAPINADTSQMGKGAASSIEQNFTWLGGTLYWRLSARGKFQRILPPTPPGAAVVYIDGSENSYFLLNEQSLTVGWQTFTGSVADLPAGTYRVKLDAWNKDEFLKGTVDDGAVYYDDVYFSYEPVGAACEDQVIEATPTPSFTGTPGNTATPTSEVGNWTPTPDGSPTPTSNPEILNVWNCGFEAGRGSWTFNSSSGIGYAGGPRGAQHAISTGYWPSVYQHMTTRSAQIYITAWVRARPYIRLVNRDTLVSIDVYTTDDSFSDWQKIYANVYAPAGNWRLELNNAGQPNGIAYYDGVTVSYGTYATEAQSWCAVDPTPGPTTHITLTPTPTGTRRPTSTPYPTYTSIASMTPERTWTPGASDRTATSAQATATAQGTPGPGEQTATYSSQATAVQGTATAQGTPAPTSTGTGPFSGGPVTPGPQQPNGGQGANCIRPSDWWRLDNWAEFMGCDAKKFLSWGDDNTRQVQGIWNDLQRYEPFGTIAELDQANKAVGIIINSYNWQGTGAPGTNQSPSKYIFDPQNTILNGRQFSLTLNNPGPSYAVTCDLQIEQLLGWQLGKPICFIFDILYQQNLIQWFQFFINMLSILALIAYVNNNFIRPGSY